MTAETLNNYTCKDLARMAKRHGVRGWHGMRKDQLVRALVRMARVGAARRKSAKITAAKLGIRTRRPLVAASNGSRLKKVALDARSGNGSRNGSTTHGTSGSGSSRSIAAPHASSGCGSSGSGSSGSGSSGNGSSGNGSSGNGSSGNGSSGNGSSRTNGALKKSTAAIPNQAFKEQAFKDQALKEQALKEQAFKEQALKEPALKQPPTKGLAIKDLAPKDSATALQLRQTQTANERLKNLAQLPSNGRHESPTRDRLVVMVRGPYWLHASWELTRQGVERAQAAMGQEWHSARPVIRVFHVTAGGTTSASESLVRDVEVHGGVNNWYIDVKDPPQTYRLDIGYRSSTGRFFVLARSNVVNTPKPGCKDAIDENWNEVAENFDKIYAMSGGYAPEGHSVELQELFEERLRRPMGSPLVSRFGAGADGLVPRKREFDFQVDAELIVFGSTEPNAHVTLQGEPVRLRPDGTFTVRFSLPNCRQVIPAVACSRDGLEQRTVVLAVERNTKTMEPLSRDSHE